MSRARERIMPDGDTSRSRPTIAEHLARIDECVRLLRMRAVNGKPITFGSIKKLFASQYGSSPRTVMRYIKKAQDRIVAESGLTKSTHKALTVEFLNGIIGDTSQKTADRLAANKQYMDLFGLAAPPKTATGADGGLQQHLHLHGSGPLTIEQRKQALLEHLGIREGDQGREDGRGIIDTRAIDAVEVPCRVVGGSGSVGWRGASDGEGMEIGTESDARE